MIGQGNQNYEIPAEMRDFAEKSVEQARKALDGFMGAARRTVDTFEGSANTVQSSAKDVTSRTFALAERNMQAAFDHAQRLVRAKDPAEVMRLQTEFVQSQFASMQSQMRDFGGVIQGMANQATQNATSAAQTATNAARNAANTMSSAGSGNAGNPAKK